jgi:hypothetical protein
MEDFMLTLSLNQIGTDEEISNINVELTKLNTRKFNKLIILGYIWPAVAQNLGVLITNSLHVEVITPIFPFIS